MRRRSAGKRVPLRKSSSTTPSISTCAFVRCEQPRDDVHQRRLAAAGAAEQTDDARGRDLDRHVERESIATFQGANAEHAIVSAPTDAARAAR
jgi:hypothetical protein